MDSRKDGRMKRQKKLAPLPRVRTTDPVKILQAVINVIREEPLRYDQSVVVTKDYYGLKPACGTVCCVGGWVNVLTRASAASPVSLSLQRAGRVLKLTDDEEGQLFDSEPSLDPQGYSQKPRPWTRLDTKAAARQHMQAGVRHIKAFALKKWGVRLR